MNNEIILKAETMGSLQIAEITGKNHAHVIRDIRNLLSQGVTETNFGLSEYKDQTGRTLPCYQLTKKGCLILASGYNALLRERIINRWEELENANSQKVALPSYQISDPIKRAEQWIVEEKQRQLLLAENEQQAKELTFVKTENETLKAKQSYLDIVLQSRATVTTTQIAQDYALSAKALNKKLHEFGVQHKVSGQWILYGKYLKCGYVQSETINIIRRNGTPDCVLNTKWTQKGRLFLYDLLKKHGILPTIERKEIA